MKIKHLIGLAGITVFFAAWAGVAVGYALGVDVTVWTTLVVIAAFASEALIWCLAAMLGLTVFEARRKIRSWLARPFRKTA
ncbi:MAG: hypothetical protein PVI23_03955 [Maricaulaceae bacterium]|jgi:hypothetical protein